MLLRNGRGGKSDGASGGLCTADKQGQDMPHRGCSRGLKSSSSSPLVSLKTPCIALPRAGSSQGRRPKPSDVTDGEARLASSHSAAKPRRASGPGLSRRPARPAAERQAWGARVPPKITWAEEGPRFVFCRSPPSLPEIKRASTALEARMSTVLEARASTAPAEVPMRWEDNLECTSRSRTLSKVLDKDVLDSMSRTWSRSNGFANSRCPAQINNLSRIAPEPTKVLYSLVMNPIDGGNSALVEHTIATRVSDTALPLSINGSSTPTTGRTDDEGSTAFRNSPSMASQWGDPSRTGPKILAEAHGPMVDYAGENPRDRHSPEVDRAKLMKRWMAAYDNFKFDGGIHRDELLNALAFAGYENPRADWCNEAADECSDCLVLEKDEYVTIMDNYLARHNAEVAELFRRIDTDQNGLLSISELMPLFEGYGITPLRHVIKEIVREVDLDFNQELSLQEFFTCLDIVRFRFGFPKTAIDTFLRTFRKFDADNSGTMDAFELKGALNYLHITISDLEVVNIRLAVDLDKSGDLSEMEFLMCMSRVRELELTKIKQLILEHDADGSGSTCYTELTCILQELGCTPEYAAMRDTFEDLGLDLLTQELDLSGVSLFVDVFRQREGLPRAEYIELAAVFNELDCKSQGFICNEDGIVVLRRLGYMISADQCLQQMIREVDVDESGFLDLVELGKLVRIHRMKDIDKITEVFEEFDEDEDGVLSNSEAYGALTNFFGSMVQSLANGRDHFLLKSATSKTYNKFEFVNLAFDQWRNERIAYTHGHAGYSEDEVKSHRQKFYMYAGDDADEETILSNERMRALISDLLEGSAAVTGGLYSLQVNMAVVQKVFKESAKRNLKFTEYLQAMRLLENLSEHERLAHEREVVGEIGFRSKDVAAFRHIFFGDGPLPRMRVELEDVAEMLDGVIVMSDKILWQLERVFNSIVSKGSVGPGAALPSASSADFPAFLRIMDALLQINLGSIKELSKVCLEADEAADTSDDSKLLPSPRWTALQKRLSATMCMCAIARTGPPSA